jgi:hypothetical protein
LVAGVSALLFLATSRVAGAGNKDDAGSIWQDSDRMVSRNSQRFDRSPTRMPGRPIDQDPIDENPVAPVPEPGTMALAAMGLVSLGAALRKRRAARSAEGRTGE